MYKALSFILMTAGTSALYAEQAPSNVIWQSGTLRCVVMPGTEARPYVDAIVRDCVEIFKELPNCYEPNYEEDRKFFDSYCSTKRHVFLVIFDGEKVVGFSHALGLDETFDEIKQPFIDAGLNPANHLYISEALLGKLYRGQKGLLRTECEYYETFARKNGFSHIVTAVVDHPASARIENICKHFGFERTLLYFKYSWMRTDTKREEEHSLHFWSKRVPTVQTT